MASKRLRLRPPSSPVLMLALLVIVAFQALIAFVLLYQAKILGDTLEVVSEKIVQQESRDVKDLSLPVKGTN